MDFWIVGLLSHETHLSVNLYPDEKTAWYEACDAALGWVSSRDHDSPFREEMLEHRKQGNHISALQTYAKWLSNQPKENIMHIYMTVREVRSSISSEIDKDKPDVPCKQCGNKVSPSDETCWWCQINNPAS